LRSLLGLVLDVRHKVVYCVGCDECGVGLNRLLDEKLQVVTAPLAKKLDVKHPN
jgi:hypothetical protein